MERLTESRALLPTRWQVATVSEIRVESPRTKTFRLEVPNWMPHIPGQHYDVRLTAADGYSTQRSYSVASSPLDEGGVELTIDLLEDGEVSGYFHDVLAPGDQVEVRGPFASFFVWRGDEPGPIVLVGGGSGVVPLMSMLRHKRRTASDVDMRLLYSVRCADDAIYKDQLGPETVLTYTRESPPDWTGHRGRIDPALVASIASGARTAYVCGSNPFVESASSLLIAAGIDATAIRTERFGPSG